MLGKRSRPAIGKLAEVLRSGIMDTLTSPRSPLDCKALQTPRKLKSYYCDQQGGVGLGIVVALDNKSSTNCNVRSGGEVLVKYAICSQFSSSSLPINVGPSSKHNYEKINNNRYNYDKSIKEHDNIMDGLEEEFTYVTCHGPNKSTTTTRVYYGGSEYGHHHEPIRPTLTEKIGVFNISSPARFSDDHNLYHGDSDFLSSCHLCRKGLQGKDIYMYRGEKAFCSAECRQRQIRIDERKERCRSSEASRSSEVSSSPYSYTTTPIDQIFFTGIVAA